MIDTISIVADSISVLSDTLHNLTPLITEAVIPAEIDTVSSIQPTKPIDSTVNLMWIFTPTVIVTIILWFFNGRPILGVEEGVISKITEPFGSGSENYLLKLVISNYGKRSAKFKYSVIGYNDPGEGIEIDYKEGETIQGGILLDRAPESFTNPIPPQGKQTIELQLNFFERSCHWIVVKLFYTDNDIKIYFKHRNFHFILGDNTLINANSSQKKRIKKMMNRVKKFGF